MTLVELEYPKRSSESRRRPLREFACEPAAAGYGTTLGNSLRRVLLSLARGRGDQPPPACAGSRTSSRPSPGVKEDVVQIVLN